MPEIKKITDFTELAEIPADNDVLPIVDLSEAQLIKRNKKITYNKLVKQALAEFAAAMGLAAPPVATPAPAVPARELGPVVATPEDVDTGRSPPFPGFD